MKKEMAKQHRNTKKVLPTKKFPELKLMINGEYRNSNNTLSSEDDSLAVSSCAFPIRIPLVPAHKEDSAVQRGAAIRSAATAALKLESLLGKWRLESHGHRLLAGHQHAE